MKKLNIDFDIPEGMEITEEALLELTGGAEEDDDE